MERITDTELLRAICWGDSEDFETLRENIDGQSRWAVKVTTVVRRVQDGKLFLMEWRKAATERQEHEYPDEAVEAEEFDITVTHYHRVKK